MSKLRVYTSPSVFFNPQRLRLFIFEKGTEGELEEIVYDMTPGGDQRKWQHLKMNSWRETPMLRLEDGSYIAETESALEQAQDTMWDNRIWVHIL